MCFADRARWWHVDDRTSTAVDDSSNMVLGRHRTRWEGAACPKSVVVVRMRAASVVDRSDGSRCKVAGPANYFLELSRELM